MILDRLLARGPAKVAAAALLRGLVLQSRGPALYERMGAQDTPEGRFEMLGLHAIVLIDRLARDADAASVRQALFDAFIGDLDGALREMGVGDLAVGKRMRSLAQAFYGRARAYDAAFNALPNPAELIQVIARTVLDAQSDPDAKPLAGYVERCRDDLAEQETALLVAGLARWPAP
ncbi:MAG TPA: ubiquinol-cytochrome C chaperone family protein [Caulobacteraceae bacterium]